VGENPSEKIIQKYAKKWEPLAKLSGRGMVMLSEANNLVFSKG
jgi:hypothetical protein